MPCGAYLHPLTAKAVPSPYKQGESAIRTVVVLCTLYSVLCQLYSVLCQLYSILTKSVPKI